MTKHTDEITGDNLQPALLAKGRRRRKAYEQRLASASSAAYRRNDLTPQLEQLWLAPSDLQAALRRLRKADPAQVTRVKHAIETLGFCEPVLINRERRIIHGHARWQAAMELALPKIPCLVVDHLTAAEQRVLALALNRHAERGEWDFEALKPEFDELIVLGAPLGVSGFEAPQIDLILLGDEPAHETGPLEPDETVPPISRPGDLWRVGAHLVACADARDPEVFAALMAGEAARLVLTDPPYNVPIAGHVTGGKHREFTMASGELSEAEFARFNRDWMAAALVSLTDGGLVMPFIDWRSVELMIAVGKGLGLDHINLIAWVKDNAGQGGLWRSQHELIPVFKLGTAPHVNNIAMGRHGRRRSNVWQYPGATSMGSDARKGLKEHPTVKPVALLEDALLDVTNRGEIVLDPFLGSGSTLVAAEKTGRICRAIELDPLYVDLAIRRWVQLTGKRPELVRRRDQPAEPAPIALPASPLALAAPSER